MNAATLDAMTPLQRTDRRAGLGPGQGTGGHRRLRSGPARSSTAASRFLLGNGREFLRRALEDTLQARVDALEKKARPAGSAPVA